MPCCVVLAVLLGSPRLVVLALWLFSDYLARAGLGLGWVILGLVFLPCTTVACAIARNELGGLHGWGLVVLAAGVVLDLAFAGGGGRARD